MKLSITTRLTITFGVLTALVFLPAALFLYHKVASGIRAESVRIAEAAATNLAFIGRYQWDDDLLVEYKAGVVPLETLNLGAPHWAVIRGDGTVERTRGIFEVVNVGLPVGGVSLVIVEGESYRVAAAPLMATRERFENLPKQIQASVREKSPDGIFLRAKWESAQYRSDRRKGTAVAEVSMLEPEHMLELRITRDGRVHKEDKEKMPEWVPRDLVEQVGIQADAEDVSFGSWKAYNGQLIAVLRGTTPEGEFELAVNRVGERFILDDDGTVVGPDPDSRLWMFAATDASPEVAATTELRLTIGVGLPLLWGAIVFIGWYVTRRALSPVENIVDTVERIELSRLDERLHVGEADDELSRISTTVNRMLDRIEDGYERERQFTGDASHELRGPLAKVIADIDVALSQDRAPGEYRETLLRCRRYAERMQHLVESLLWLARLDSRGAAVKPRPFDLTDLLTEVVRMFPTEDASRVRLDFEADQRVVSALGDPDLIRVMLQNLVQNALRYSSPGDPVNICLGATNGVATVEVRDHGEGIADDELSQVFSRFYRVDKSRSRETGGFGLGLAIVDEVAQAHGFRVSLSNAAEGGVVASFSLPTHRD